MMQTGQGRGTRQEGPRLPEAQNNIRVQSQQHTGCGAQDRDDVNCSMATGANEISVASNGCVLRQTRCRAVQYFVRWAMSG